MTSDKSVQFLYKTALGRGLMKLMLNTHADRIAVAYLKSSLSKPMINRYAKKHGINMDEFKDYDFHSFRDFFARKRSDILFDRDPKHLISPSDSFLSAYTISKDSVFHIKGSYYSIKDLIRSETLADEYQAGSCLIFRLCASDYHHYCHIDDGYQGKNHYIPGRLHSVQPAAFETYPIFKTNRRTWTLMATENFGPVVQINIGAFVVGGIINLKENSRFAKVDEMGYFDLAGSTIVLLFQSGRISLCEDIASEIKKNGEARVKQGMWIASASDLKNR